MKNTTFESAAELVTAVTGNTQIAEEMARQEKERELIHSLMLARVARNLTQGDIARRLGVSVSTVSRMEDSTDAELRIGEILDYVRALGESSEWQAPAVRPDSIVRAPKRIPSRRRPRALAMA